LAITSREIASHHFTAGTLSDASFGPDIQAQDRSLIAPLPFGLGGSDVSGGPLHSLVVKFVIPCRSPALPGQKNGL
jgi:hypothetical protein